jgi:hypothetical protein
MIHVDKRLTIVSPDGAAGFESESDDITVAAIDRDPCCSIA